MKGSIFLAGVFAIVSVVAIPQRGGVPVIKPVIAQPVDDKDTISGNTPKPHRDPIVGANVKASEFSVVCNPENLDKGKHGYEPAMDHRLEEGAKYLNKDGTVTLGAYQCERISCSFSSAIFVCNNTGHQKAIKAAKDIAVGARAVIDKCSGKIKESNTKGAGYHSTGWKVELRAANC